MRRRHDFLAWSVCAALAASALTATARAEDQALPAAGPLVQSDPAVPAAIEPPGHNPDSGVAADGHTPAPEPAVGSNTRESMCLLIESAAKASALPLEFFARVIWQESRFQSDAIGPVTRSGQRALGIAQFMPRTADERRLLDPFDPVQALPKSAEFLAELRVQFGNLGLAAAAYNAGPRRVQEWLTGTGAMPLETRRYVQAITGSSVEEWRDVGRNDITPQRPAPGCRDLMALLTRAPNPFVAGLAQRVTIGAASPWGVQLAAGFSRDKALAMYARAIKRLAGVIGDRDPDLLGSLLRNRGSHMFYQVRVGADTRADADALCGRIRRTGQACLVLRNPVRSG